MPESEDFRKQYSYNEMSNKVISSGRRNRTDNDGYLPKSVAGSISAKEMGTRAIGEPIASKPKTTGQSSASKTKKLVYSGTFDSISYHPTTDETSHVFDLIVTEIGNILGDQSHEVLVSAADSVLEILKNEDASNSAKRKQISGLLEDEIDEVVFNELLNLARKVNDYQVKDGDYESETEINEGLPVVFDEDEDEDGEEGNEPPTVEAEDVSYSNEVNDMNVGLKDEKEDNNDNILSESVIRPSKNETEVQNTLPMSDIDFHYIQREIGKVFKKRDPSEIAKISTQVSEILSNIESESRDVENDIMELFDYENFETVKNFVENRWRIAFKLKILNSADEDEKEKIIQDMINLGLQSVVDEMSESNQDRQTTKRKLSDKENEEPSSKKPKPNTSLRKPKIVNLSNLVFDEGSHLMTNTKVKLPQGSYQQNKKSYDIISIPPPQAPPINENEKIVKIKDMPEWTQSVFPSAETSSLNRVQSRIYPSAFLSDENLLLCAPTGAGKTNVALLTVLRLLDHYRDPKSGKIDVNKFKIVYIAPLKALVQEQMREFQRRLTPAYGIVVNELTGDSSLSRQQIKETQILVTTPEKWDVITRKDNSYSSLVKLVVIDEIHLLHDERGPVLESIVARTLRHVEATGDNVRLVGLSATLPNYRDVANFLRVDFKKGLYYFDSTYRPCPLAQQFISIKEKKAIKKLNAMNEACYEKMIECLQNSFQLIIFVHSRKETYKTAKWLHDKLTEDGKNLNLDQGVLEVLSSEAESMENRNLHDIIPKGIGMHHAGLKKGERTAVEDLFAQGHLKVLVSTATLAWGVNLPAHTVVIKGTETYSPEKGTWIQLSPQDILQMLGRAGRPRYDTNGEGVIITSRDEVQYYLAVLNQQLPIESQFISRLVDNLNAEVILGTVTTREEAVKWLGYTYLYIRMLNSPSVYLVGPEYADDEKLYWKRTDLIHSALQVLNDNKLIIYNSESGSIKPTELGKIASHFYISYDTINMYNNSIKPWSTEIDIFKIFASSGEFKYIPTRSEEKMEVRKLIEKCPIPIKETPDEPIAKINMLLQMYISNLTLDGFALMADMIYITQSAGRLLRAIHELCKRKQWSGLTKLTLNICKMVEKRMWMSSSPFRQFGTDVPKEVVRTTEASNLPLSSYFKLDAEELAEAINLRRNANITYELLQQFPRFSFSYFVQPITTEFIRIQVEIMPEWKWNIKFHGSSESFLILVEDCDGEKILFSDELTIYKNYSNSEHMIDITVPLLKPLQPNYVVNIISQKWLHSEWRFPVSLYNLTLPRKPNSFTSLLNLQSVPTSALKSKGLIDLFPFNYFNRFQSQVFPALFNSDENIFIGTSKGGGKTVCAELAIIRHWTKGEGRIFYFNPSEEIIEKLIKQWSQKFSSLDSKIINRLTGDLNKDLAIVASSHLTLGTPEQFEYISRRWRQRKALQSVGLVIMDDSHWIGSGVSGSVYEVAIARLRFISTQVDIKSRVVALSTPLIHGRDFGEWLGCTKANIFNFDPTERFNQIDEIRIQAVETNDFSTAPIMRHLSNFLKQCDADDTSLVFTSSRKNSINAAMKLISGISGTELSFLKTDLATLEPYLKRVKDLTLREALTKGIGIYYHGMDSIDKLIVEKLLQAKSISLVFASKDTSYSSPNATNVVILGNKEYDGKEHRFADYTIVELLEMIGCCKDDKRNKSKVLVLSNTTKVDYYTQFFNAGLPIESYMNFSIHDNFLSEIVSGVFGSQQDCIDWITFTYFYRRLQMNPNFYDVKDTSHLGVSEYLSELVENTLKDLEVANLIELDDDEDEDSEAISPLNGAIIASHYNIPYDTIKDYMSSEGNLKLRGILEKVTSSTVFETIPIREDDAQLLRSVYKKIPIKVADEDFESPYFKAFILLQAHFSRISLTIDLAIDQKEVLKKSLKLLYACIDCLSSEGHLSAIHGIDISQMIVQGLWNRDNPLKQLPHINEGILERCKKYNVETVYDIMALEDEERDDVLRIEDNEKLNDVAEFVNKYPNIDLTYELDLSEDIFSNQPKKIVIKLERDEDMEDLDVVAPYYPFDKTESWWIVIGNTNTKELYAIKKTTIAKESQQIALDFTIPTPGHTNVSVWCMCDSYLDADKEISFQVDVQQGENSDEEDS